METELYKKLVTEPERWLYYLILAVVVIFLYRFINAIVDIIVRHLFEKVEKRKSSLSILKVVLQVISITLVIYIANSLYWSQTLEELLPSPTEKPITTFEATIEIQIDSDKKDHTHFMDRGGYLAFKAKDRTLLMAESYNSRGRPIDKNRYMYRAVLKMDATDNAVGRLVETLLDTEYVEVVFAILQDDYEITSGRAICVINSEIRFVFIISEQKSKSAKLFVRNLKPLRDALK